jgi:hypothetical protein
MVSIKKNIWLSNYVVFSKHVNSAFSVEFTISIFTSTLEPIIDLGSSRIWQFLDMLMLKVISVWTGCLFYTKNVRSYCAVNLFFRYISGPISLFLPLVQKNYLARYLCLRSVCPVAWEAPSDLDQPLSALFE